MGAYLRRGGTDLGMTKAFYIVRMLGKVWRREVQDGHGIPSEYPLMRMSVLGASNLGSKVLESSKQVELLRP